MRADRGQENTTVALMQMAFRYRHEDSLSGANSFRFGKSVHNQASFFFFENKNLRKKITKRRENTIKKIEKNTIKIEMFLLATCCFKVIICNLVYIHY